jgi:TrmH family RNA methyltransferase
VPVQISSSENPKVKELRSLYRRSKRYRERLFLIEGVRLVEEALGAGVPLHLALYAPERLQETPRGAALLARLSADEAAFPTRPPILDGAAGTVTPQGVVAAVPFPDLLPRSEGLVVVLDQLRDPGNCGTILRTAEAAGASLVYCAPKTVDPFSPKVVRAGMGVHFRLPLRVAGWGEIARALAGHQVWLAEARGGRPYDAVDWCGRTALIVGGEAEGAGEEARRLATGLVAIPMAGGAESLNAAVAAGILLFEALRQRGDTYRRDAEACPERSEA